MNTTLDKAKYIYNHLKPLELTNGGTRIIWADDTSESVREWFNTVNGEYTNYNLNELDETYIVLKELAGLIVDSYDDDDDDDDMLNRIYSNEWAYNSNYDLLQWAGESLGRLSDIDDQLQYGGAMNITGAITGAMNETRGAMGADFYNNLKNLEV